MSIKQSGVGFLLIAVLLALAACGGGGGGGGGGSTPTTPTGVSVAPTNSKNTVSWDAVSGATSYTIYSSTSSAVSTTSGTPIANVTSPYTHSGLTNGTTYYYIVTASNSTGESSPTSSVSGTPGPWTRQFGAPGIHVKGQSVATDTGGNVYIMGTTNGGLDGNAMIGSSQDCFVTKYNSLGVKQYTRQLGLIGGTALTCYSLATDASDNFYVAGFVAGALDGNVWSGGGDFFVTKYNSSGVKQYTRQLGVGAGANAWATSLATDTAGNVYVAGQTSAGLDGNVQTGSVDFFFTKYNSSGVKQYTRQLGAGAGASIVTNSVATDAAGNVYVAGYIYGGLGLDGNAMSASSSQDCFVTKYNSLGVKQYTRQLGVALAMTRANSVGTDAAGNVYVAGSTTGGLDGNTLTGSADLFVTKYNSSGVKQYTRQLGGAGFEILVGSAATDSNGNVYVAGSTFGGLDGNMLTGILDSYVTKYDNTGMKQYTRQLGAAVGSITYGKSVALDTGGNVYVGGYTNGSLDGNILMGYNDFFVTKYDSNGVKQ